MRARLAVFLAGALVLASPVFAQTAAPAEPVEDQDKVAVLRALDKVTARVSTIEVPIGGAVRFGTLRILARTCNKRPPEEPPETAVFLEILDMRPGDAPQRVFTGWMFASSPALSAMEHPTYDVWPIDCKAARPDTSAGSE